MELLRRTTLVPNPRLKRFLERVTPLTLQRTLGKVPSWSIGLYAGPTPLDLQPAAGAANPVLTRREVDDVPAIFVADPFGIQIDGSWHLYFEVLNGRTRKGEIGLATSEDLRRWTYRGIVLAEPFHLSYPYVFGWQDDLYLVPECWENGEVRLYRSTSGGHAWQLVGTLVEGPVLLDPSLFHHAGRWWMFAETNEAFALDTLRLFSSPQLQGPWLEHPASPVVTHDPGGARPGGRVIDWDGRLIRYGQDCRVEYGAAVSAFEIVTLTDHTYAERMVGSAVVGGSGTGWNRSFMHHVDAHRRADGGWLAFVDGW